MHPKQTLISNLQAEINALEDHAREPFQDEPGKRLFVQIVFVLLCAGVGGGIACLFTQLPLPPWSLPGVVVAFILASIFAAIWTIVRSGQNYRRYRGLCQELHELQRGTHDQEFVTDTPDLNELNNIERWILGKPAPTGDQLMAHPQSRALRLPWWQLIGRSRWHPPAAFIATLALNLFAIYVLLPLPLYSFAAAMLVAAAPIPLLFVLLRWRMFRMTKYDIDPQATLLNVLTGESNASLYQNWLVLHRLKTKGLIDPDRMEPFEDGFPTTRYLFSVFYPLAAVLPIEVLTVNPTKLTVACNCLLEA
jgi:hypothetical protein